MSVEISITDQIVEINETSTPVEIYVAAGAIISPVWGGITGTLSTQTDLQNALNAKYNNPTGTTLQYLRGDGTLATFPTIGTVTSVGLTSATSGVTIGSSPITTSGNITLAISTASGSVNGLLSSTDWTTFNSKENVLTFTTPLSRATNTISIPQATTSVSGFLSSTDWTTFNSKQNLLTNPITGTGTSGQVAYFTGATTQAGSSTFLWNAASNLLRVNGGIGINRDAFGGRALDVTGGGIRLTGSTNGSFEINGSNGSFNVSTVGGIAAINITDTNIAQISMIGNSYNYSIQSNASSFKIRDITASNTDRFVIHSTGNLAIGSATDSGQRLQVTGSTLLNGDVTFSSATGMFWDATNSRLGIGTTLPTFALSIIRNENTSSGYEIQNNSTGTSANAGFIVRNSTHSGQIFKIGTGYTTYKTLVANDFGIYNAGAGDISFLNDFATGKIKFTTGTSSVAQMTLTSNGRLLLGSTTEGTQILQVTGQAIVSSTTTHQLEVANPSGGRLLITAQAAAFGFSLLDSQGYGFTHNTGATAINARQTNINIWTQATDTTTLGLGGQDTNPTVARTRTNIQPVSSASIAFAPTSGTAIDFNFRTAGNSNFTPTSGTATYTLVQLNPTINQTGGANGITRGLYVNPTLTAAADWRSIETSNSSGYAFYGAGTANSFFGGNVGVGILPSAWSGSNGLQIGYVGSLAGRPSGSGIYLSSNVYFVGDAGANGANARYIQTTTAGSYSVIGNNHYWFTAPSGTLNTAITWTIPMTLTSAGRLILGAGDSGELLQVNGTAKITGATTINGFITNSTTLYPTLAVISSNTIGAGMYLRATGTSGGYFTILSTATGAGQGAGKLIIVDELASATRFVLDASGNVGIGTASPNASAITQIDSTTKGFLPPRMTTVQKNAIATPAAGLMVYDTTLNQMSYYNATMWINF